MAMFHVQRSIPFPPIRLDRLVKYLQAVVQRGSISLEELKKEGLDFGKGRGDITRFLERLGLVTVSGKNVAPTKLAYEVLSIYRSIGPAVFHPLFNSALPQYRLFAELIESMRTATPEELHGALNKRLSEITPSGWINNVAFKSLLAIAVDIGVVKKEGRYVVYVGDPVARAFASNGPVIGGAAYVEDVPEWLRECSKQQRPLGIAQLDPECASRVLERHISSLK
ncbi:MAG: hypothetical protein ACP5KY_07010 [Thermoproteus sp.]